MATIVRTKRKDYDDFSIVIDLYDNDKVAIYDYANDFRACFFLPDVFNYLGMLEVIKNCGDRCTSHYRKMFHGLYDGNFVGPKRIQHNIDIIKEFTNEINFPNKEKQLSKKELQNMSIEQLVFVYQKITKKGERS